MVPPPASIAPLATVTGVLPRLPLTRRTPAFTAVAPVWLLVPVSVHTPVPTLMMLVVPAPFTMLPAKVVSVPSAPML